MSFEERFIVKSEHEFKTDDCLDVILNNTITISHLYR